MNKNNSNRSEFIDDIIEKIEDHRQIHVHAETGQGKTATIQELQNKLARQETKANLIAYIDLDNCRGDRSAILKEIADKLTASIPRWMTENSPDKLSKYASLFRNWSEFVRDTNKPVRERIGALLTPREGSAPMLFPFFNVCLFKYWQLTGQEYRFQKDRRGAVHEQIAGEGTRIGSDLADLALIGYSSLGISKLFGRVVEFVHDSNDAERLREIQKEIEDYNRNPSRQLFNFLAFQLKSDLETGLVEFQHSGFVEQDLEVRVTLIIDSTEALNVMADREHGSSTIDWFLQIVGDLSKVAQIITVGRDAFKNKKIENCALPDLTKEEICEYLNKNGVTNSEIRKYISQKTNNLFLLDLCAREYRNLENRNISHFEDFLNISTADAVCWRYLENRPESIQPLIKRFCLLDEFDEKLLTLFQDGALGFSDYLSAAPIREVDDGFFTVEPTLRHFSKMRRLHREPGQNPPSDVYADMRDLMESLRRLIDKASAFEERRKRPRWEKLQDDILSEYLSLPADEQTEEAALSCLAETVKHLNRRLEAGVTGSVVDRLKRLSSILAALETTDGHSRQSGVKFLSMRIAVLESLASALRKRSRYQNLEEALCVLREALAIVDRTTQLDPEFSTWRRGTLNSHIYRVTSDKAFIEAFRTDGNHHFADTTKATSKIDVRKTLFEFQTEVHALDELWKNKQDYGKEAREFRNELNYHRLELAEALYSHRRILRKDMEEGALEPPIAHVKRILNDLDDSKVAVTGGHSSHDEYDTARRATIIYASAVTRFPGAAADPDHALKIAFNIFGSEIDNDTDSLKVFALWARCSRLRTRRVTDQNESKIIWGSVQRQLRYSINKRRRQPLTENGHTGRPFSDVPTNLITWYFEALRAYPESIEEDGQSRDVQDLSCELLERLVDIDDLTANKVLTLTFELAKVHSPLLAVLREQLPRDLEGFSDRLKSVLLTTWSRLAKLLINFSIDKTEALVDSNVIQLSDFLHLGGQDENGTLQLWLSETDRELNCLKLLRQLQTARGSDLEAKLEMLGELEERFGISPLNRRYAGELGIALLDSVRAARRDSGDFARALVSAAERHLRIACGGPDAKRAFRAYARCRQLITDNVWTDVEHGLPPLVGSPEDWVESLGNHAQRSLALSDLLFASDETQERQLATRVLYSALSGPFSSEEERREVRRRYGEHLWHWMTCINETALRNSAIELPTADRKNVQPESAALQAFAEGSGSSLDEDILQLVSGFKPESIELGMILVAEVVDNFDAGVVLRLPSDQNEGTNVKADRLITIKSNLLSTGWYQQRPKAGSRALITVLRPWKGLPMATMRGRDHISNILEITFPGALERLRNTTRNNLFMGGSNSFTLLLMPALEKSAFLRGAKPADPASLPAVMQRLCHLRRITVTARSARRDKISEILNVTNDVYSDLIYVSTATNTHSIVSPGKSDQTWSDTHFFELPQPGALDDRKLRTFSSIFEKAFAPDRLEVSIPSDFEFTDEESPEATEAAGEKNWIVAEVGFKDAAVVDLYLEDGRYAAVGQRDTTFGIEGLEIGDRVEIVVESTSNNELKVVELRRAQPSEEDSGYIDELDTLETDFETTDVDMTSDMEDELTDSPSLTETDNESGGRELSDDLTVLESEIHTDEGSEPSARRTAPSAPNAKGDHWRRARISWTNGDGPIFSGTTREGRDETKLVRGPMVALWLANIAPDFTPNPEIMFRAGTDGDDSKVGSVATQWFVQTRLRDSGVWLLGNASQKCFSICAPEVLRTFGVAILQPRQRLIAETIEIPDENLKNNVNREINNIYKNNKRFFRWKLNTNKSVSQILHFPPPNIPDRIYNGVVKVKNRSNGRPFFSFHSASPKFEAPIHIDILRAAKMTPIADGTSVIVELNSENTENRSLQCVSIAEVRSGKVKFYDSNKGFGYVETLEEGRDLRLERGVVELVSGWQPETGQEVRLVVTHGSIVWQIEVM